MTNVNKKNIKNAIIYIILIILVILISLQSAISPINRNGYIPTDVAVWTNIAKKMCQGEIMYKDFFDHKGPILYFLYYFGYTLGGTLGIWCIELICNIINVFMIYKISELILKKKRNSLIVVAVCMCFMSKLCIENPCTESIALPLTLIAFYQFIKFIIDRKTFKIKEILYTAISFAIVLLLRPNLASLWVVYYIYLFIKLIKEKEIKYLLQIIGFSIIGVIIVFLPIMMYLIVNGAFTDFINTYLLFNLKYINNKEESLFSTIQYFMKDTDYMLALAGTLYIALLNVKSRLNKIEYESMVVSLIYFVFTFLLAVIPQRLYEHYIISILPALIIPVTIAVKHLKIGRKLNVIIIAIAFVYTSWSLYDARNEIEKKFNNVSFYWEIAGKLQQITKKSDNVLVLGNGNNTTIYLISDREYKGKYLYQLPLVNENTEIAKEIINELEKELPDFIVYLIYEDIKEDSINFEKKIEQILDENYVTEDKIIYVKTK